MNQSVNSVHCSEIQVPTSWIPFQTSPAHVAMSSGSPSNHVTKPSQVVANQESGPVIEVQISPAQVPILSPIPLAQFLIFSVCSSNQRLASGNSPLPSFLLFPPVATVAIIPFPEPVAPAPPPPPIEVGLLGLLGLSSLRNPKGFQSMSPSQPSGSLKSWFLLLSFSL